MIQLPWKVNTINIWVMLLICNMLVPVLLTAIGAYFYKENPGDINDTIGYRTKRSMKNRNTWDFANRYCGGLFFKYGIVALIVSAAVTLWLKDADENLLGHVSIGLEAMQLIPVGIAIWRTERALKARFDDDGEERRDV